MIARSFFREWDARCREARVGRRSSRAGEGADVDASTTSEDYDRHAVTALDVAAERGDLAIVRRLLAAGADAFRLQATVGSPVHAAARGGGSPEVLWALLDAHPGLLDLDFAPDRGVAPGWWRRGPPLVICAKHRHADRVDALLRDRGASSLAADDDGYGAASVAVQHNDVPMLRALKAASASFAGVDVLGYTAAHIAAKDDRDRALVVLAEGGADLDAVSPRDGHTPASLAANEGSVKTLQVLIDYEADVDPGAGKG